MSVHLRDNLYFYGNPDSGAWYFHDSNLYFGCYHDLIELQEAGSEFLTWSLFKLTSGREIYIPLWQHNQLIWKD